MIRKYLDKYDFQSGSLCLFACWIMDFFEVYPIDAPVRDLLWFDSSPYIRPLTEALDEYENAAVVVADNKKARVFLVTMSTPESENVISGHVKNHVKKGGWSQQRYERRRDKQLLLYAREIVGAVTELEKTDAFRRLILVGGKEILQAIYENLPSHLIKLTGKKPIDLHQGEEIINREIMELFTEQERQSELELWEKIRSEYMRDGLGDIGIESVLQAAQNGQVETLIVERNFKSGGCRCRDCEHLHTENVTSCTQCGSASLFDVDLVNEIVEIVQKASGEVDFADPIETLSKAGHIGALLRFRY